MTYKSMPPLPFVGATSADSDAEDRELTSNASTLHLFLCTFRLFLCRCSLTYATAIGHLLFPGVA